MYSSHVNESIENRTRMDDRELESLFRDLESDRVERKSSASDRNKIRQAVCAFANDLIDSLSTSMVKSLTGFPYILNVLEKESLKSA